LFEVVTVGNVIFLVIYALYITEGSVQRF